MERRRKNLTIGIGLLVAFALGMVSLASGWHVERAYRHVVVEIHNVNDVGRVDVNCERAAAVPAAAGKKTVDLGYLSPDDRISLSAFNEIGDAAWGFRVDTNGKIVFNRQRGRAQAAGFPADEYAVVMAKSLTADGDLLGTIGCDPQLVVSPILASYRRSADDSTVKRKDGVREQWQPRTFPFAAVEEIADWTLPLLALVGCVAAAATTETRRLIRRHWKIGLAIASASLLLNFWRQFGLDGLIIFIEVLGSVILLLFAAGINLWIGFLGRGRSPVGIDNRDGP